MINPTLVAALDAVKESLGKLDAEDFAGAADAAIRSITIAKAGAVAVAEPFVSTQENARCVLVDIIARTGETNWVTESGRAYVPAAGVAVSYDAKALDALCASNAELAAWLKPHRKESARPGSLTVKGS